MLPSYLDEPALEYRYQKIRSKLSWISQRFDWYGGAAELMECPDHEAIISGPYETGKTIAALVKLHTILWHTPNVQALMIRQTYNDLIYSAVVTFENKVLPYPSNHPDCPVTVYGGKSPSWYDYPNGSRLTLAGMDRPGKVLSSEYDMIYVNQAEELLLSTWETLAGRTTGRAGHLDNPQLFGDCNPSYPEHWIKKREQITLIPSHHEDNPVLFDHETGEWTEQGEKTMEVLRGLTGLRRKRGYKGLWVQAEGVVYDNFDEQYNVSVDAEYNPDLPLRWGVDDGYVCGDGPGNANYHPRVILFVQRTAQGGLNVVDEYVACGELAETTLQNVAGHLLPDYDPNLATRYWKYKKPEGAAVDSSATQLRAAIGKYGILNFGATHKVNEGIKVIRELTCDAQGVRQIKYHPRCKHTIREKQTYAYADNSRGVVAGEPAPKKIDDHCMDAERYVAWRWTGPTRQYKADFF